MLWEASNVQRAIRMIYINNGSRRKVFVSLIMEIHVVMYYVKTRGVRYVY